MQINNVKHGYCGTKERVDVRLRHVLGEVVAGSRTYASVKAAAAAGNSSATCILSVSTRGLNVQICEKQQPLLGFFGP
jgi:hypothetical protein